MPSKPAPATEFSGQLLAWFRHHGRHDLPWQDAATLFHIWVSEVMLQQTQVATVVPYYLRFITEFPDVTRLAAADSDAVLRHWAGLGYYSRARNLHRAARIVVAEHGGEVPQEFDALMALPGIGRSTAGAILALGLGRPFAILDGNVKRVLCRFHGLRGWAGQAAIRDRLWALSEMHLPGQDIAEYTQAIMDLGATICRRARPLCESCPVSGSCTANKDGTQATLPESRRRPALPERQSILALIQNDRGEVLLERRPATGIWGGLWSLPECPANQDLETWAARVGGALVRSTENAPIADHTFTHFRLRIQPVVVHLDGAGLQVRDGADQAWLKPGEEMAYGMATPVRKLVQRLVTSMGDKA